MCPLGGILIFIAHQFGNISEDNYAEAGGESHDDNDDDDDDFEAGDTGLFRG